MKPKLKAVFKLVMQTNLCFQKIVVCLETTGSCQLDLRNALEVKT